jgi:predicted TIM-barrel fold metal-dependent hydrolase
MRTITLEEHFATPDYMAGPGRKLKEQAERAGGRLASLIADLLDLGDGRIAAMDAAGVGVQALSLTSPGVEQLPSEEAKAVARQTNAAIGEAVRRRPDRFFGLASLPLLDPPAAIGELERAIAADGCKGVVINGHVQGRYLDDRFFWPVLQRAEALKLPIYLHPTQSPPAVVEAWYGGLKPAVAEMMANGGWGWHIETALHVLRMVLGGVFDAHPELQIVIGHMGETLPFMIERVDMMPPSATGLKKPISAYLRANVHYTFAGFNFLPTFLQLMLEVGVDRILFSADHPYRPMAEARAFLDSLPVSPTDRERIAHGNAERLFGV